MSDFIGAAISATASHINKGVEWLTRQHDSAREFERQKEFAQNGLRWRVEDAKAAGIHPIFAVGANTPTYSPQAAVGTDFGISEAGQNIARAIEAKQTKSERQEMDDLQKALVAAQIRRTDAETKKIEDSTIDDALRFAALSSRAVTQHQPKAPPMPTTDTGSYDDLASGIKPYVVGDTIMEFPPEEVADLMEDPKVLAIWKAAIEAAWHTDPKLREHVIRKLPKTMQSGLKAGTHELVRIPGYGLSYRKKQPKVSIPPFRGGMRGYYGGY